MGRGRGSKVRCGLQLGMGRHALCHVDSLTARHQCPLTCMIRWSSIQNLRGPLVYGESTLLRVVHVPRGGGPGSHGAGDRPVSAAPSAAGLHLVSPENGPHLWTHE